MNQMKKASKAAVICYSFGDLASQFVWTFVGSYLTIFYTDIVGLTPVVISMIMLGARIWDAVNDPMMGAIAEKTRSKLGRFRPYIAFGCPFLAIFGVLTFTNPFSGTSKAGVIWAAVTCVIAGMLYTLVNIPYSALAGVMTEDAQQRVKINASRSIGMNVGMLIVNACSAPLMLLLSGKGALVASAKGYAMTAVIYGVLSIPLFLIVVLTAKEQVQPQQSAEKISVKDAIGNLVKNKYLMLLCLIMTLIMTAFMGRLAVVSYYVIYCLGSFELISVIMTIPTVFAAINALFVPTVVKKIGKRNALMITTLIQAVGLLIIYFAPFDNVPMVIVGSVIYGLFNMAFPLTLIMLSDTIDYMELRSGIRTDGTAFATYGLAIKAGNAIGGAVGVILLSAFGYVANQQQTMEAMQGINLVVNAIPAVLYVLASICCLLFWKMSDKDADDIREQLRAKNVETK